MIHADPAVAAIMADLAASSRRALIIECRVLNRARPPVTPTLATGRARQPPDGGGQPFPSFLIRRSTA